MRYHTRKVVKPGDLNPNGTLFGGRLLEWIDEEAGLYTVLQLETSRVVTKSMSEIDFVSAGNLGDIIEIGVEVVKFGNSSMVLKCEARNKMTKQTILTVDKITFVHLDEEGRPTAHGKTEVSYGKDRNYDL